MRILLLEDDKNTSWMIWHGLKDQHTVDCLFSSKDVLFQAENNLYDLYIIESHLPGLNGIEVCRKLRAQGQRALILLLTPIDGLDDRIQALDAGADDVISKPLFIAELRACIRALSRRGQLEYNLNTLRAGDVMINLNEGTVYHQGVVLALYRKQFLLLEHFLRHPEHIMTRNMLLERIWESSADPLTNTVDVHIKFLRDKLDRPFGSQHICTIYGSGYKFSVEKDG